LSITGGRFRPVIQYLAGERTLRDSGQQHHGSAVVKFKAQSSSSADDYLIDADYPIDLSRRSSKNEDGNLSLKKSNPGQTGDLCSNRPEIAIPAQKIKLDNKTRFG
jgi:hypothetical protein